MDTQVEGGAPNIEAPGKGRLMTGVALIVIGATVLLFQLVEVPNEGALLMSALALIFLVWGVTTRSVGLLIPGGILAGIALGVYLSEGPLRQLEETADGGVFLVSFAAGWALITVLSVAIQRIAWWPLIPAGIMAVIGGAMLVGGAAVELLEYTNYIWPLALIGVGAYLLLRRRTAG